jgi:hypothetical protein
MGREKSGAIHQKTSVGENPACGRQACLRQKERPEAGRIENFQSNGWERLTLR